MANTYVEPRRPGFPLPADTIERWLLPTAVLLYLVTIMLPVRFNVGTLALSLNRIFLLVMILPLGINLLAGRYGRLIATDFLFLLFLLWSGVALAVNNPSRVIEQMGSVGVEFLGGYILGRALIRTPEAFMGLVVAVAVCVCISVPLAIHEALTGEPILLETLRKIPGITPPANAMIQERMGLDRAQVMMPHPILYGLFCSTAFSLVIVGLKGVIGDTTRIILGIASFLGVFFALSSGALLSVVLQLGLMTWAAVFDWSKNRWLILFGFLATLYILIDVASNRAPVRVFMSYATFSAHNAFWRGIIFDWGMMNVWDNPIFGIGLRGWVRPHFMRSASVDNFWLLMTMRNGIPGFLFLATGVFTLVWQVARTKLTDYTTVWRLRRAWVFTVCGVCFTLATVAVWEATFAYVFFLMGAGAWFIFYKEPEAAAAVPDDDETDRRSPRYHRPTPAAPSQQPVAATRSPESRQDVPYTRFPNGGAAPGRYKK